MDWDRYDAWWISVHGQSVNLTNAVTEFVSRRHGKSNHQGFASNYMPECYVPYHGCLYKSLGLSPMVVVYPKSGSVEQVCGMTLVVGGWLVPATMASCLKASDQAADGFV